MRLDAIKNFRKKHESMANNNKVKAAETMNAQVTEWLKDGTLVPQRISFRALLEGLTDFSFGSAPSQAADAAVKMAEAITGSAFPVLTNTILNAISLPAYNTYAETMLGLITEGTARITDAEKIAGTTELGQPLRRLEKHAFQEDEFGEKDVTIYKGDFGRIVSLTFESLYNDETGAIFNRARMNGEKAGQHIQKMIMETIEGSPRTAFEEASSRAFVYKDTAYGASSIYSSDHSTIDGVTNPNAVTGGIAETGLTNAWNAFTTMKDTRGDVISVLPNAFLHHVSNMIKLRTLLATAQAIPDGNSSAIVQNVNPWGPSVGLGSQLNPVPSPFLGTTYSYMGDFKSALVWLWVERPNTVVAPPDTNLAFEKRIVYRNRFSYFGGCGLRDYRFIVRITN